MTDEIDNGRHQGTRTLYTPDCGGDFVLKWIQVQRTSGRVDQTRGSQNVQLEEGRNLLVVRFLGVGLKCILCHHRHQMRVSKIEDLNMRKHFR